MSSPETFQADALFATLPGFDVNAAFQGALSDVVTNAELALTDKIQRLETIIQEGTSEVYQEFIDFRFMAAQMELACAHDHVFNESLQSSESLSGFMREHADHDRNHSDNDEEIDPKTGRKRKKKKRFLDWLLLNAD